MKNAKKKAADTPHVRWGNKAADNTIKRIEARIRKKVKRSIINNP